jgi:FkbM family methyltransferase
VERLARGHKIKRRLPNGTQILLSPDSQLKYLTTSFNEDLIALAKEQVTSESVVWDIGANCGVFAFSCAAAKQVLAIEADPFLVHLLQESVALGDAPVTVISAAVSDEIGLAEFSIAQRGRASNHLTAVGGRSQAGGERGRLRVPTLTLDSLLAEFPPPTFIEIDVEGAEIGVLKGAMRVLNEARPILYLETDSNTHESCQRILTEARYELTEVGASENFICTPTGG